LSSGFSEAWADGLPESGILLPADFLWKVYLAQEASRRRNAELDRSIDSITDLLRRLLEALERRGGKT
jgi:hypothetical protein